MKKKITRQTSELNSFFKTKNWQEVYMKLKNELERYRYVKGEE